MLILFLIDENFLNKEKSGYIQNHIDPFEAWSLNPVY